MAFTVKIAGVDKTSLIKAKTLITDLAADHRDSCRFTIMTQAGTYLPRAGMSVTVEDGGTVFAGLIDSAPQTKVSAEDGASTNITVAVSAKGLYAIPYRRSATESYTSVDAGDIVSDLITSYLAAEGITAGTITAGAAFDAYDTYGKSIGAVLDELANASGYQWYIDNAKALHFVQDIVASAAAHDIDTSGAFTDFRDVLVDESLDQYRNRQIIRGGIQADGTSLNYVAEDAAEIAARATIEGGSGVYEHVHTDTNIIDATNAAAVAANLLKKYGRVQLEIGFRSFATDWRPATKLKVNLAAFGISSDRYFLVERVSMQDIGGATLLVTVNGVSKNDSDFSTQMSDRYIDFFAKLLAGQKQNISYTNAVAAGKNKVYFQAAQPTGGTYTPGDTWFDTNDDNRIYEWDGSAWVAVQFGENAIADLAITNAKIANATISNAKIANIDAGKVTTGYLAAARIQAGTLTFDKLESAAVTSITDTIDLGGRNLLLNSHFDAPSNFNGFSSIYGTQLIEDSKYKKTFTSLSTAARIEKVFTLNETGQFVYSVCAKVPMDAESFIWREFAGLSTVYEIEERVDGFHVYSVTFSNTTAGSKTIRGYLRNAPIGSVVEIEWEKLEKGNKATDWTPAPEDKLSEGVSYAGVEIDATNGFVSTATIGGNTIQTKANATEGFAIYNGSDKVFGVDTDGRVFASSLSNLEDSSWYATMGVLGTGASEQGLVLYSSTTPKYLQITESSGTVLFKDKDFTTRIALGTSITALYDSNETNRFIADSNLNLTILSDSSGTGRFYADSNSTRVIDSGGANRFYAGNLNTSIRSPDDNTYVLITNSGISIVVNGVTKVSW